MITTEMTASVCMAGGILTSSGRHSQPRLATGDRRLGARLAGSQGVREGAIMQFDDDTQPPQAPLTTGVGRRPRSGPAADAGIGRIHVLAWRDLEDVEAGGSELHASTVAALGGRRH